MAKRKDESIEQYNARQRDRQKATREQRNAYMREWRTRRQAAGLPTGYRSGEYVAQKPRADWMEETRQRNESRGFVAFESNGRIRYRHQAAQYGLTPEQFEAMLLTQCGRCAVCGVVTERLQIDHSHATGKVRGLLCGRCNRSIHIVEEHLEAAMAYLHLQFATGQAA